MSVCELILCEMIFCEWVSANRVDAKWYSANQVYAKLYSANRVYAKWYSANQLYAKWYSANRVYAKWYSANEFLRTSFCRTSEVSGTGSGSHNEENSNPWPGQLDPWLFQPCLQPGDLSGLIKSNPIQSCATVERMFLVFKIKNCFKITEIWYNNSFVCCM